MFENVIIGISVVLIIWGSIFSWRIDNIGTKDMTEKNEKKEDMEDQKMKIFMYIFAFVGGGMGVVTTVYLIFSAISVLAQKIYRKIKFGNSLYD